MKKIKITALPCLCADVFDGTNEIRSGGEALNFAVHASRFENTEVTLLGVIGDDVYGKAILADIAKTAIDAGHIRIDRVLPTATNRTFLTADGDRFYKDNSWDGRILENLCITSDEEKVIAASDVVFVHFRASCFNEVVELKKKYGFKLAVDFDVYRDFAVMERFAPFIDFFMISGSEELLHFFCGFSEKYGGLFNMTLGENGSVTYFGGREYRVNAEKVDAVADTTGCGDSYHAGFVCSYLTDGDIERAMHIGSHIAAGTLGHYGGF